MAQRVRWGVGFAFLALGVSIWAAIDANRELGAAVVPPALVLNEIHYSPAAGGVEFIELHSTHDVAADVSGYEISGVVTLPPGTLIDPDGFIVVTADRPLFESLYPGVPALEWNVGASLDDRGQRIVLTSDLGVVLDDVAYGDGVVDPPPHVDALYTVDEVIDGTISAGDGANPNEESPMGLHDAPLYLPQGWNWTPGPTRNSEWGTFGTGDSLYAEWRCAVIPDFGHNPPVPFRVNVRNASYWQFANDAWSRGFDVDLTGGHRGSYLGNAGELNTNPYSNSRGQIAWTQEADGSFSAPWDPAALMMHFWASQRLPAVPGQTAELSTGEVRLQQPHNQTVDLSSVDVLFQCGVDYYSVTTGQGIQVPGPGIGKYHRATTSWKPTLWTTLPPDAPAASTHDFRTWLSANLPPSVFRIDYDASGPWPVEPAGSGPSLELLDPTFDNNVVTSWVSSEVDGGTPGMLTSPTCNGVVVTVDIGAGDVPTGLADVILGTEGADVINALGGDDTICGLGGDDTISGGAGDDTIFGEAGDDSLRGNSGDDLLFAGFGSDDVRGGPGVDVLYGGDDDDVLVGQGNDDTLHGDGGDDTLRGSSGDDTLNGGIGDDRLFGGAGVDMLHAGDGADYANGGNGDDTLNGHEGPDRMYGGAGIDTMNGGDAPDKMYGQNGDDVMDGGAGNDLMYGQAGDDALLGGSDNIGDRLYGGSGNDDLRGQGGNDSLFGGDDNDVLFGGSNNDLLNAGNGDDILWGEAGTDLLVGGPGADQLAGGNGVGDTCNGTSDLDTDTLAVAHGCESILNLP